MSPSDGREGWTVVDDSYVEHVRAAQYLRWVVDRGGSVGTARTYAGRLALWLGWTSLSGVDEVSPGVEQLAAFARWLERTPRKHRRGPCRRRAADPNVVTLQAARSPATVDGILAAVGEFVRFGAGRGWCEPEAAGRLSSRRVELRFLPRGMDRGERTDRPVVERRLVRRRRVERPPRTVSAARCRLWCRCTAC